MKDYDKYIFDLDYTLLIPNWSKEKKFFEDNLEPSILEDFLSKKELVIDKFYSEAKKYDVELLISCFKFYGFNISEELIHKWLVYQGENIIDTHPKGVQELFGYLKDNNKSIVVLTSWFRETQVPRLKKMGLYEYIDEVITGDDAIKPHLEAFLLAIGDTPKDKCIMIGNDQKDDIDGAKNAGIDSYFIKDENSLYEFYQKVRNR